MDRDQLEIIKWLNSLEGRRWSRSFHRQSIWARKMFTIKDDFIECFAPELWQDWGSVDTWGRYRKPSPEYRDNDHFRS